MTSGALHTFTSHIAGKNATVNIYGDRIEWDKPRGLSGGKMLLGTITLGTSLLATGVKNGNGSSEMIPIKAITSVSTKRDGFSNTLVQVLTAGGQIDFRVAHKEAEQVKSVLTRLMLEGPPVAPPVTAPAPPAAPAAAASPDAGAQLTKLSELHTAGILTDDEFSAKKAEILARM